MSLVQLNQNFEKLPKNFSQELEDKWIAVLDGRIIGSEENFKKLFSLMKERGIGKKVLFHKVPKKEIIII